MKLSVSAYRAHASAHKKILSSGYHSQLNYGSTVAAASSSGNSVSSVIRSYTMNTNELATPFRNTCSSDTEVVSPSGTSSSGQDTVNTLNNSKTYNNEDNVSNGLLSDCKHTRQRHPMLIAPKLGTGSTINKFSLI
ncbi:uncharacterized protein LOC119672328 [Teleopsis dalmanni]|uniref:uncharacterized protein LOC119672328 n=1 Tax=Teleopsis dalmanni TaxID=139649 RepID=UPI0018CE765B|nr:uncharacterized protein LOC119672328 [Teleopsis dalmanni]